MQLTRKLKKLALAMLCAPSFGLFAGEKAELIIEKTIQAYGGDKLVNLQNIRYQDSLQHFFEMQSGHAKQGAFSAHLNQVQLDMKVDFAHQSMQLKRSTRRLVGNQGQDDTTQTHWIFTDNKGYVIDHGQQLYRQVSWMNFSNADAGYRDLLDTLVIKQLADDVKKAQWIDTAMIKGHAHDVLLINAGEKDQWTLYINQTNSYLTRLLKKRGQEWHHVDFLQHKSTDGITWASGLYVSRNNDPLYLSYNRSISVNLDLAQEYKLPTKYAANPSAPYIDDAKLGIRELSNGVYFVGHNWGYTLFFDAGDYYISAGAWGEQDGAPSWRNALELLRKTTGDTKPIKQHLVSHHHTDHMSGLTDVLASGANMIIHPAVVESTNAYLKTTLEHPQIITVEQPTYLAEGKILIFDVPTSHASHNLVMYLKDHKLLFSEDIFGSSYDEGFDSPCGWPNRDTYQRLHALTAKVEQLGLTVDHYVSSHHWRILSQADINEALNMTCLTSV